jgi:amino acid transporter
LGFLIREVGYARLQLKSVEFMARLSTVMDQLPQWDLATWIGMIGLVLTVPLGVASHFIYNWLIQWLERRRLIKTNQTKQQAVRQYKLITAFREGKKDKYAHYLLWIGWAAICAVASATATILVVLINPQPPNPLITLIVIAVGFIVIAILLMLSVYITERRLDNFDAYKAEVEEQWGPIEEE